MHGAASYAARLAGQCCSSAFGPTLAMFSSPAANSRLLQHRCQPLPGLKADANHVIVYIMYCGVSLPAHTSCHVKAHAPVDAQQEGNTLCWVNLTRPVAATHAFTTCHHEGNVSSSTDIDVMLRCAAASHAMAAMACTVFSVQAWSMRSVQAWWWMHGGCAVCKHGGAWRCVYVGMVVPAPDA